MTVYFIYSDKGSDLECHGTFETEEQARHALEMVPLVAPSVTQEDLFISSDDQLGLVAENRIYGVGGNILVTPNERAKHSLIEVVGFDRALEIQNEIFTKEWDATIEGEWAEGSEDPMAVNFRNASEEEQKAITWLHANRYASELAQDTHEALQAYGGDYFIDMLDFDLEGAYDDFLEELNKSESEVSLNRQIGTVARLIARRGQEAEAIERKAFMTKEDHKIIKEKVAEMDELTVMLDSLKQLKSELF